MDFEEIKLLFNIIDTAARSHPGKYPYIVRAAIGRLDEIESETREAYEGPAPKQEPRPIEIDDEASDDDGDVVVERR